MAKILIGTATTDANGVATITYESTDAGDINIIAKCEGLSGTLLSEAYTVEDCRWYDDASSNKSSSYTQYNSPSFSYNTNGYYRLGKSSGGWGFVTPMNTPITTNDNISIEVTWESVGKFGSIGLYKSTSVHLPICYYTSTEVGMYGYGSTNAWVVPTETTNINPPVILNYELNDGKVNLFVYDENKVLIWSKTNISIPSIFNNSNLYLVVGMPDHSDNTNYSNFKNLKIKRLHNGSLTLTADKSILSYQDSDTCTLTATLTGKNISGKTVEFFSGNISIGSAITDSNGVATLTYASQGIGDVSLSASVGTLTSETYEIEDCIHYWTNLPNGDTTINYSLPSSFKMEFRIYATELNHGIDNLAFIRFNNGSGPFIGKATQRNGTIYYFNRTLGDMTANTDCDFVFTYNNGSSSLTDGTITKTSKQTVSSIFSIESDSYSYFKYIKIKPLYSEITLTADKSILSYQDSDTITLTATLTGDNVANKTVGFFNGDTSLGTSVTDSNGIATFTYESQGIGNMSLTAQTGNLVSEIYDIVDAKYYASNSRINSEGFAYNNDRYLFYSTYKVAINDEIHFRFKTVPTKAIVGIATWSPSVTNQFLISKDISGQYDLIKNRNGDRSNVSASVHGFYTTQDLIIKVEKYNTYNRVIVSNDSNTDWWEFKLNNGNIRVDKFFNYDYDIEVFVL